MKSPTDTVILIVDDDPAFQELAYERLSAWGYQIHQTEDGATTREWLAENRPDLILLDVNLPDESGISICRWLKSDLATRDIPIIQITALPHAATRKEAMMAGVDDYFSKPVDFHLLQQKIEALLVQQPEGPSGPDLPGVVD